MQEEKRNGEEIQLIKQVCKKMQLGQNSSQIASDLVEDINHIQEIYDVALTHAPDFDPEAIYNELSRKKELIQN